MQNWRIWRWTPVTSAALPSSRVTFNKFCVTKLKLLPFQLCAPRGGDYFTRTEHLNDTKTYNVRHWKTTQTEMKAGEDQSSTSLTLLNGCFHTKNAPFEMNTQTQSSSRSVILERKMVQTGSKSQTIFFPAGYKPAAVRPECEQSGHLRLHVKELQAEPVDGVPRVLLLRTAAPPLLREAQAHWTGPRDQEPHLQWNLCDSLLPNRINARVWWKEAINNWCVTRRQHCLCFVLVQQILPCDFVRAETAFCILWSETVWIDPSVSEPQCVQKLILQAMKDSQCPPRCTNLDSRANRKVFLVRTVSSCCMTIKNFDNFMHANIFVRARAFYSSSFDSNARVCAVTPNVCGSLEQTTHVRVVVEQFRGKHSADETFNFV